MEDTSTDLSNVLNDQPEQQVTEPQAEPPIQDDPGEPQASPPDAKPQPQMVPVQALEDERRKRQQMERELEQFRRAQQPQPQPQQQGIDPAQFNTYEEYLAALAERQAQQVVQRTVQGMRQAEQQRAIQQQTQADIADMNAAGKAKYADFETIIGNPDLPITDTMMHSLLALPHGHEVGYFLGTNPAEAYRIANLAPSSQAREIGKLAQKLAAPPAPTPRPSIPQTLTQTRSADGRFSPPAYNGPTPLTDILGNRR